MSTLWTPSGEHQPSGEGGQGTGAPTGPTAAPPGQGAPDAQTAEAEEQLRRVREELSQTPVEDIVANHVVGLWQLAVLHMDLEGTGTQNLEAARVAIDSVAALVQGLGSDLGQHEEPLRDALTQIQNAYVDVSGGSADDAG